MGVPTLSLPKVLAASFAVLKAMTSQFVANYKNLCKSKIKASLSHAATMCPLDPSVPIGPSLASSLTTTDIEAVVQ